MIIDEDHYLMHYGILRKSGRYPWGSGGNTVTRSRTFLDYVKEMIGMGMTETQIAKGVGMSSTELRALKSIAKNEIKQAEIGMAIRLREKGLSNGAIAERMGVSGESYVRSLLQENTKDKADILATVSGMLKERVDAGDYVDIGGGVEHMLNISKEKLATAVARLKAEGYVVIPVQQDQLGTGAGKKTTMKVLAPPGTDYRTVVTNKDKIRLHTGAFFDDGGRTALGIQPPINVSSRRLRVRYAEDGGSDADGVIYVRPGKSDLSLGEARYGQVRIAVDGSHYIKGMAMYRDDLPPGVDLVFNTNKRNTGRKLDALKPMKDDPDSPFGSVVRQIVDPRTKKVTSAMNIVNEEGDWDNWSRNLSSQMLSKQRPQLAKEQLDMTYETRKNQLDTIMALTNPAVKRKLLEKYAEDVDAAAIHLKAAALPNTNNRVILPINSMRPTEVYAPSYNNGDRVVLIRYPHGGIFEIPELVVNNRHPAAKKALGDAKDAIGINAEVAKRLSGADFDGDTVLVIPNRSRKIETAPSLERLKEFDPQSAYKGYEGMKKMDARTKGMQMGLVSNLITDMTIKGAPFDEISRAVRHSMVVIDAEKHGLDYRRSAIDHGIPQLMKKYQNRTAGGASTLISRKKSEMDVPERKQWNVAKRGAVDPATGKKVFEETGASYVDRRTGQTVYKTSRVKKLAELDANDPRLSSGTKIERVYANHSNRLKDLANKARKEAVSIKSPPVSPTAKQTYASQVASLDVKLRTALRNRPLERQAQVLAGMTVKAKMDANPEMDQAEIKKLKGMALEEARTRTGAHKEQIDITPEEWAAIQAGAISANKLRQILDNSDLEVVKKLATPKEQLLMSSLKVQRAQAMAAAGYTQAEIAAHLGVSLTTLKNSLNGGG